MVVDYFARRPTSPISPWELNNEGRGMALVLRYAGCNLRCPLCYAWKYAWSIQNAYKYNIQECFSKLYKLLSLIQKKITWVRIQGGEPCLTFQRILASITLAINALKIIHIHGLNYYNITRAIIQTNGITFSNLSNCEINQIKCLLQKLLDSLDKGRLIFEVSFKSPNDPQYLTPQIEGYNVLLNNIMIPLWEQGFENIAIYPIAGFGPSIDHHNLFIIPIDPSALPKEIPLFHSSTWCKQFKHLVDYFINNIVPNYNTYNDFKRNPQTNNGRKIAIEELEPTKFQASWISRYAKGEYMDANLPINRLLRKLTDNVPQNPKWRKWYNSWISRMLFGRSNSWMNVFKEIPVANDPAHLLSMVDQMNDYFYPSHPIGHYPYL